jgi:HEAT repeat protein
MGPEIEIIFQNLSSKIRKVCIGALKRLVPENADMARHHVIRLISDKDKDIRFEAFKTLNRLKIIPEIEDVIPVLEKEKVSSIKVEAARILGNINKKEALAILFQMMKDSNDNVRYWASKSLGGQLPLSLEILLDGLKDKQWNVRKLSARALTKNAVSCEKMIYETLENGTEDQQFWLLKVIGEAGLDSNAEKISLFLKSRNKGLRLNAVRALGLLKKEKFLAPLIFLLKSGSSEIRDAAAQAVINIGDSAIEPLCRALGSKFWHVRKKASEILVCLGVNNINPIFRALASKNPDARFWAVRTLGLIKDPRALRPLLELLKRADSELRAVIIEALGNIKDASVIPDIVKHLSDRDERVCLACSGVLISFGTPAVNHLLNCLGEDNYNLRKFASKTLEMMGDKIADQVAYFLNDPNPDKSFWAARTLGKLGGRAVEPLKELLNSSDIDLRLMALKILGEARALDCMDDMISALQDEYWSVRKAAAQALGCLGSPRAIDALKSALEDEDEMLRAFAVEAMGKIGDPGSVRYIIPVCDDIYAAVRLKAVQALGNIGDTLGLSACIEALNDTDSAVLEAAVESIGRIKDVHALPALLTFLEEKKIDNELLEKIALVLGEIGDPRSIKFLIPLVFKENIKITRAASAALAKIGTYQCEQAFIKGLSSKDWKTRSNCFKGLSGILTARSFKKRVHKEKKFIEDPDFARQGLLDDAIVAYNKTLKVKPDHFGALINLGLIYEEKNMFEDAVACFKKAMALDENRPEPQLYLGVTFGLMGQKNRSKAEFKKVIKKFPHTEQARIAGDLMRE